ncbi:MAG: two-component regulator propeller domain-containing protein [Cyclobacteriaceae bacterium]
MKVNLILLVPIFILACSVQTKKEDKPETPSLGTEVKALDNSIWEVFQDSKDAYWFGSNGKGLYRWDGERLILFTTEDGLVGDAIRGIQEDMEGNLFIETTAGIGKYDGQSFTTLQPISSTSNEWKLEPTDLWFGYDATDLYRYDGRSLFELKLPRKDLSKAFGGEVEGVPFESNNNSPYAVYGVNKDKEGNVWFGTATAGAFRYDGESFLWVAENELSTLPDGRVPGIRSMIQDKNGYMWLSNFHFKYKINAALSKGYEKTKTVDFPKEIAQDKIRYFNSGLADDHSNLWMTTYGGGVWHYDGEKLTNQEIHNGKEDVLLIDIYQDSNGTIWLGTANDGVYRQKGDEWVKFEIQ